MGYISVTGGAGASRVLTGSTGRTTGVTVLSGGVGVVYSWITVFNTVISHEIEPSIALSTLIGPISRTFKATSITLNTLIILCIVATGTLVVALTVEEECHVGI